MGATAPWDAARAAARNAVDLARTAGASSADRTRAEVLRGEIENAAEVALELAAIRAKDERMRERLTRIRLLSRSSTGLQEADAEFRNAYADYGIDVATASVEEVAVGLSSSSIASDVVAGFDRWSWIRRRIGGPDELLAGKLLEAAQRADPDARRVRIRAMAAAGDLEGLRTEASAGVLDGATAFLLALHLGHLRDHEAAVALLRAAYLDRPDDFWFASQLARELTVLDVPRWVEAVSFYRAALALRPESLATRHRLAFALERAGDLDQALALWQDTLHLDPERFVVYQHIVHVHEQRGTLAEALDAFSKRAREAPGDAEPWLAQGLVHLVRNEWDEAARCQGEALARDSKSAEAWICLGDARTYAGDEEAGIEAYARAADLAPDQARIQAKISFARILQGRFEDAAAAAARATEIDPRNASYWAGRGQCWRLADRAEEALPFIHRAVDLEPDHYVFRQELAWTWLFRGEYENAVEEARIAGRLDPLDPEGRFNVGVRKRFDSRTGEVVRHVVLGWSKTPDNSADIEGLALEAMGDFEGALAAFEAGLERKADDWFGHHMIGCVLRRMGRNEEAIEHLRISTAARPDDWANYELLAFALLGAGDYDGARETFASWYEMGPFLAGWNVSRKAWDEQTEILVAQARSLPRLLEKPRPVATRLERGLLVWLAAELGRPAGAARLAEQWLDEDPDLALEWQRWPSPDRFLLAAVLAALDAGCGFGSEPTTPEQRAAFRDLARTWLRRDLELWRETLASGDDHAPRHVWFACEVRLTNSRFAKVRDASELRRLPQAEAEAWRGLWEEIRALHSRARRKL